MPLGILLENEVGHTVLSRYFGELPGSPMVQMDKEMSLKQIAEFAPDMLTPEILQAISDDLAKT